MNILLLKDAGRYVNTSVVLIILFLASHLYAGRVFGESGTLVRKGFLTGVISV